MRLQHGKRGFSETRCNPHLRAFLPPCLIRVQYPPNEYSRSCLFCFCVCGCGWEPAGSIGNYPAFPGESLFFSLSVYPQERTHFQLSRAVSTAHFWSLDLLLKVTTFTCTKYSVFSPSSKKAIFLLSSIPVQMQPCILRLMNTASRSHSFNRLLVKVSNPIFVHNQKPVSHDVLSRCVCPSDQKCVRACLPQPCKLLARRCTELTGNRHEALCHKLRSTPQFPALYMTKEHSWNPK